MNLPLLLARSTDAREMHGCSPLHHGGEHGCCTRHFGADALARGVRDEPTMLERCTAAACFQLESRMKAVLRMLEGSAEGFPALSKGRDA